MRKSICSLDGNEVDLDNSKTYDHLPNNIEELRELMFYEIGKSYCYMNFQYHDIFKKQGRSQKKRINTLIKNFVENKSKNINNVRWYHEQIFLLQDEIENMC